MGTEYDHPERECALCIAGEPQQHNPEPVIYGLWWGGSSYGQGDRWKHLEAFVSLEDACVAARDRWALGHDFTQDFVYVNQEPESALTPAVGEDSNIWIFLTKPSEDDPDWYPDHIIEFDSATEDFTVQPT